MGTEKLKNFLSGLSPEARRLLVRGIEEARARGELDPSHEFILSAARETFLKTGPRIPRINNTKRLFFTPLEPFLISEILPKKQRGRIHRSSLDHIWNWVHRDLAKDKVGEAIHAVDEALTIGEPHEVEGAARILRARFLAVAREYIAALVATSDGHRRLASQLGGQRVLDDLRDFVDVLEAERALGSFLKAMPEQVTADRRNIEKVTQAYAMFLRVEPGKSVFALAALMGRFDPPEDFLRFIVEAVGSDDLAVVAKSEYAPAIDIALTEIARLVERFSGMPRTASSIPAIQGVIRQYHRWMRTFSVAFEVSQTSEWGKRISEFRSTMSNRVSSLIEPSPLLTRRALRPVRTDGILRMPDPEVIDEALVAVSVLETALTARESLALNRMLPDTRKSIEQVVETMTNGVIAELRDSSEAERPILSEYAQAGINLSAAVFGEDYAAVIRRARHVAMTHTAAR